MVLISLRGDGPWRGRSTRQISDRGGRFQIQIRNGYVSGDGHEIRSFPGWTTLVDLTNANNPTYGFRRLTIDAVRPTTQYESPEYYPYGTSPVAASMQTLVSTAEELHLHCFEQIRGKLQIIGERGFRKAPLYSASRNTQTITGVVISGGVWILLLSSINGAYSSSDSGASLNGIAVGDIVYVENVMAAAGQSISQAHIDLTLNGRFHKVTAFFGFQGLILGTSPSPGEDLGATTVTGEVWRTRNNVSDIYPTPNPISPWEPSRYYRIDDPPALACWTVYEPLGFADPAGKKCVIADVANRQRDFADAQNAVPTEGPKLYGGGATMYRGWSRRQQKELPYRVNPEVAGDRIVLAAPGYLCLFQVPSMIPLEPESWPEQPSGWTEQYGRGIRWWGNDIYDKPRCLGVPKAILIDSTYKNPISPAGDTFTPFTYPYDFNTYYVTSGGFGAGTYKIAISFVDEATGEEGLASEPISVTILAGNTTGIALRYIHPGYLMPECLARRINVYMAPPGEDAMGLYVSFALRDYTATTGYDIDAAYGNLNDKTPSDNSTTIWRVLLLPVLSMTNLVPFIDFTRLAPQSGLQPRGAEAVRVIGGILFSVGHSGTHGNSREVLRSVASAYYSFISPVVNNSPDEFFIRGFRHLMVQSGTPTSPGAGDFTDGPFGVAGNYFPAAYQGIEVYSKNLYPIPVQRFIVDKVKNNATYNERTAGINANRDLLMAQRIRIEHNAFPLATPASTIFNYGKEVVLLLPRGQVQVGDPGRPGAVTATAIQFMDAKKDDDGVAVGQVGDSLVICSKHETYQLSWFRTPQGQVPKVLSTELGCIAANSMVTFDGGVAWISARGPVAVGDGVQWIGEQLEHDFVGEQRKYAYDTKGMMRHAWGAHDEARGLIYWGFVTLDATHQITYKGVTATYENFGAYTYGDEAKSRFPCNEILIWSYRANAYSIWTPPSGLEVLWMRPLRLSDGSIRMCFLAADKRIYALDDTYSDTNTIGFVTAASATGSSSTALVVDDTFGIDGNGGATSRDDGTLLRTGMTVVCLRDEKVVWTTTVSALAVSTRTITLTDEQDWSIGDRIEVGVRPAMTIQMSYVGDAPDNLPIKNLHVRYALHGEGAAHVEANVTTADRVAASPYEVGFTESPRYQPLAAISTSNAFDRIGQRRILEEGFAIGAESSLSMTFLGRPGVRLSDVLLETSQ